MRHNINDDQLRQAVEAMGREPAAPLGQCFTAALRCYQDAREVQLEGEEMDIALVHGIGTANMPGQEGKTIVHAWVEIIKDGQHIAFDPIWELHVPVDLYYDQLKVTKTFKYSFMDIKANIIKGDNINLGPWEPEIVSIAKESDGDQDGTCENG